METAGSLGTLKFMFCLVWHIYSLTGHNYEPTNTAGLGSHAYWVLCFSKFCLVTLANSLSSRNDDRLGPYRCWQFQCSGSAMTLTSEIVSPSKPIANKQLWWHATAHPVPKNWWTQNTRVLNFDHVNPCHCTNNAIVDMFKQETANI